MTDKAPAAPVREKPRQRRGERTRLKIKTAFTRLLNEQDYFDLTITDICREASVATGGFYFHYAKKADLLGEVVGEHSTAFWARLDAVLHYQDPYSVIFHATAALVGAYLDAPGVVRCFNQLAMTDRLYVDMWDSAARSWISRLVAALNQNDAKPDGPTEADGYSLLSFVDLLLFKIYIDRDPTLVESAGDTAEVTENLAVLWYRALLGSSPPAARLAYPGQGLGL